MAKEFPPEKVRAIVNEVATLLKDKKETVSVAETVCTFSFFVMEPVDYSHLGSFSLPCLHPGPVDSYTKHNFSLAAGGIISASLLSTPGASGFYKGGLTVRCPFLPLWVLPLVFNN
ncbi:hypothetical protein D0Z07_0932 [Hyphodiscus hymeniophilus]|uniref:Uncharacterized protein n=1 Tax=Hyphodiscus hymeniophilus TaxID=353542 RepID=A0A9P7B0L3_9HELO|nr:hypothetical protein D0Z07_0932 [Hyphodiscus hymeniophilus]